MKKILRVLKWVLLATFMIIFIMIVYVGVRIFTQVPKILPQDNLSLEFYPAKEFLATIEKENSSFGSDCSVRWLEGDAIMLDWWGRKTEYVVTPCSEDPTRAILTKKNFNDYNPQLRDGKYYAYCPASLLEVSPSLPAIQKYNPVYPLSVNPMYAESDTTNLNFKYICALLKIVVPEDKTVTQVVVYSDQSISGQFSISGGENIIMTNMVSYTATETSKQVILDCGTGAVSGSELYVAIPPQTYTNLHVRLQYSDGTEQIKIIDYLSVDRNMIYSIENFSPYEITYGPFSVATNKKVFFSRGNLYYTKNDKKFHFEARQTDYRHVKGLTIDYDSKDAEAIINGIPVTTPAETVGSFRWGDIEYAVSTDSSRDYTITSFFSAGDIKVDGYTGLWRVLTFEEYNYMLKIRTVKVGNSLKEPYGLGSVNGVNGLIILPDNWDGSVCPDFIYGDDWDNTFTESTATKWSSMEKSGCVFLPAAGCREDQYVSIGGLRHYSCNYWSSTIHNASSAYSLTSNLDNVSLDNFRDFSRGHTLRLVQD